jgi:hypothetical protein
LREALDEGRVLLDDRELELSVLSAEIGRCGSLIYVEFSGGFVGWTKLFRKDGCLVSVLEWSDVAGFCNSKSHSRCLGETVRCTKVPFRVLYDTNLMHPDHPEFWPAEALEIFRLKR